MRFKVLIFGVSGMLGHCAYNNLSKFNNDIDVIGIVRTKKDLVHFDFNNKQDIKIFNDFNNFYALSDLIKSLKPSIILNCIGLIKQKNKISNEDFIFFNSIFPKVIEQICKNKIKIINISTDCVFNGNTGNYNEESIDYSSDIYGISKYLGEISSYNNLTIRTSIIGHEIKNYLSLLEWFLKNQKVNIPGYINAYFSGLTTLELVNVISKIVKNNFDLKGIYHVSSSRISKFELLKKINIQYGINKNIIPKNNKFIDRSLNCNKFKKETGIIISSWNKMISEMKIDNF